MTPFDRSPCYVPPHALRRRSGCMAKRVEFRENAYRSIAAIDRPLTKRPRSSARMPAAVRGFLKPTARKGVRIAAFLTIALLSSATAANKLSELSAHPTGNSTPITTANLGAMTNAEVALRQSHLLRQAHIEGIALAYGVDADELRRRSKSTTRVFIAARAHDRAYGTNLANARLDQASRRKLVAWHLSTEG